MIVIQNVKITDNRIGYPYDSGRGPWMKRFNRFDIFKYCLESYAVMSPLISKFHFYITLEDEYITRQAELEAFMQNLFPADKLSITWARNNHTRDWRKVCDDILSDDNEVIWFSGNDDHIFIDYNLDMVSAAIKTLQEDVDPYAVVYYSHWPEQARMSYALNGTLTPDKNFVKFAWDNFDGIQIFKAARFKKYWFDADYGDSLVFRPDDLFNHHGYSLPATYYAPTREMVRHYDGYAHVGTEVTKHAPSLFIPPGFFDESMQIRIGFLDRISTYTNCDPTAIHMFNTSTVGTDYRWVEEDLPLFWRSKIVEIIKPADYNAEDMYRARDLAFLKMSRIAMQCFSRTFTLEDAPPKEWFSNHLRSNSIT